MRLCPGRDRMSHMSDVKMALVRGLIEQAPDSAIRSLQAALNADQNHDEGLSAVQFMVETEASDRRARNLVFAPIAPLCGASGPFCALSFPPRALSLIWKALKAEAPDEIATAKALVN